MVWPPAQLFKSTELLIKSRNTTTTTTSTITNDNNFVAVVIVIVVNAPTISFPLFHAAIRNEHCKLSSKCPIMLGILSFLYCNAGA